MGEHYSMVSLRWMSIAGIRATLARGYVAVWHSDDGRRSVVRLRHSAKKESGEAQRHFFGGGATARLELAPLSRSIDPGLHHREGSRPSRREAHDFRPHQTLRSPRTPAGSARSVLSRRRRRSPRRRSGSRPTHTGIPHRSPNGGMAPGSQSAKRRSKLTLAGQLPRLHAGWPASSAARST